MLSKMTGSSTLQDGLVVRGRDSESASYSANTVILRAAQSLALPDQDESEDVEGMASQESSTQLRSDDFSAGTTTGFVQKLQLSPAFVDSSNLLDVPALISHNVEEVRQRRHVEKDTVCVASVNALDHSTLCPFLSRAVAGQNHVAAAARGVSLSQSLAPPLLTPQRLLRSPDDPSFFLSVGLTESISRLN